jgi:dihydrofolate reductase
MAQNGVIGRDNALPCRLPADLRHFKALTMGHAVILGRKTFDSIGKVLGGRRWMVLTRRHDWHHAGVDVAHGLDEALSRLSGESQVFIAGGAAVYREALPRADRLFLTVIHADVEGDARFPALEPAQWALVDDERHDPDERNAFPYSFRRYERPRATSNEQRATG